MIKLYMPFKSPQQRKYCWYLYSRAKSQGKEPSWDCRKWEHETPKSQKRSRKVKKGSRRSTRKSSRRSIRKR